MFSFYTLKEKFFVLSKFCSKFQDLEMGSWASRIVSMKFISKNLIGTIVYGIDTLNGFIDSVSFPSAENVRPLAMAEGSFLIYFAFYIAH